MGLLKFIKNGLGFGNDDAEADDLLSDSKTEPVVDEQSTSVQPVADNQVVFSEDMQHRIFDGVIDVFNAAQPDFIRKSLSTDEQRKFLYDTLDASLKEYISQITIATQTQCENRYRMSHSEMQSEVDKLKENAKHLEEQREALKQQQLSAERQKRALSDRLNDLESQVAKLEAEREQADLVNRGLMNKLKVAGVQQAANESFSIDSEEDNAEATAYKEELEKLRAENAELNQSIDLLNDKSRIADELVKDMRRRAAEARQELEKCQAELAETKQLDSEIEQLHEQMTRVDAIISKRDEKIASLSDENEQLKKLEEELKARVSELTDDITQRTELEKTLRSRISELESRPIVATTFSFDEKEPVQEQPKPAKVERHLKKQSSRPIKISRPKISDSDLAEIEAGFTTMIGAEKTAAKESEFGYHAPRRQQYPESDAQMSLPFD